MKNLIYNLY